MSTDKFWLVKYVKLEAKQQKEQKCGLGFKKLEENFGTFSQFHRLTIMN